MLVVVDVVRYEECGLEDVEDVLRRGGRRESLMIGMMMSLVEQDLCGVRIRYCFDLVRRVIFAPGRKIRVEMNVGMYHT